jgi:hypothetical protein
MMKGSKDEMDKIAVGRGCGYDNAHDCDSDSF